jgi:hypothetical protein
MEARRRKSKPRATAVEVWKCDMSYRTPEKGAQELRCLQELMAVPVCRRFGLSRPIFWPTRLIRDPKGENFLPNTTFLGLSKRWRQSSYFPFFVFQAAGLTTVEPRSKSYAENAFTQRDGNMRKRAQEGLLPLPN